MAGASRCHWRPCPAGSGLREAGAPMWGGAARVGVSTSPSCMRRALALERTPNRTHNAPRKERFMTSGERRREPRYPARLQVRLKQPGGELGVVTETVSRLGFGARVDLSPSDADIPFTVQLPGGRLVRGTARCVSASRDGLSGFSATFPDEDRRLWEEIIEQERATGGLWRLIGRYATARGDDKEA